MSDIESTPSLFTVLVDEPVSIDGTFSGGEITDRTYTAPDPPDKSSSHRRRTSEPDTRVQEAYTGPAYTEDVQARSPGREVIIDDEPIDADIDLEVSATDTGYAVGEMTIYNLDMTTWGSIDRPRNVVISLGWDENTRPVFDGNVVIKRRRRKMNNRAYIVRMKSRKAVFVDQTFTRTYNQLSPHRIVDRIVSELGALEHGYISTRSERINGHFTLSAGKTLAGWLDKLAELATKQTDEEWVWYLERGRIYFHPTTERTADPMELDAEKSLLRVTPIGMTKARINEQPLECVMHCEPTIHRGRVVRIMNINHVSEDALFRVSTWGHESNVQGRHHTSVTLDPLYTSYEDIDPSEMGVGY